MFQANKGVPFNPPTNGLQSAFLLPGVKLGGLSWSPYCNIIHYAQWTFVASWRAAWRSWAKARPSPPHQAAQPVRQVSPRLLDQQLSNLRDLYVKISNLLKPKRSMGLAYLPINWGGARGANGAAVLWQSRGASGEIWALSHQNRGRREMI